MTSNPTAARLAGAGLIAASAAVHLDLYLTGYRQIPTIGWLFLVQVVAGFGLAVVLVLTAWRGDRVSAVLIPAAGAGFAVGTLAGYLVTLRWGLFGFHEVRTTAGIVAGVLEIAAFTALAWAATLAARAAGAPRRAAAERVRVGLLLGIVVLVCAGLLIGGEATSTVATAGPASGTGSGPGGATGASSPASHATLRITISSFAFHPAHATVTPGERIVVTNDDPVPHTFTASGSEVFNSGPIDPHAARTVSAPSKPGTYRFFCAIHPFMKGTLTVRS